MKVARADEEEQADTDVGAGSPLADADQSDGPPPPRRPESAASRAHPPTMGTGDPRRGSTAAPRHMLRLAAIVVLASAAAAVGAQKTDGDRCMTQDRLVGECRAVSKCPWAIELIKQHKVPEICSFRGDTAIVCCVGAGASSTTSSGAPRPPPRPLVGLGEYTTRPTRPFRPGPSETSSWETERPSWETDGPSWASNENPPRRPTQGSVGGRIARRKCEEYTAGVTQTIEALPLVPNPRPVAVKVPSCDISRLPLIVGGENAELAEFPHMAAIGFADGSDGRKWNCGGSLISDSFVMTAAHCTSTSLGPPVRVRLGELNLESDADGAEPWDTAVAEVIRHPDYRPPSKYHDIALLRLARPAPFSRFVRPACLFTDERFPVNKTVATGWGRIDYAEQPSDTLLKVALDIIDNTQCNELWRSTSGTKQLENGIAPTMMCAGVLKGGRDTCQGDSGGPIQITSEENKCVYHVIGVTSFGKFCAAKNSPGVYTRVSSYVPWIEGVVWPREE